jgi:malate synthase
MDYVSVSKLSVARTLHKFVEDELLPGSGIESARFWSGLDDIICRCRSRNASLLVRRDVLQKQIDEYHREHAPVDPAHYKSFLEKIGYLLQEPRDFQVSVSGVDYEIAQAAGPQLVVPLSNPRYAINAANARWGSLYDALYGTDALLPPDATGRGYDAARGKQVVAQAKKWLDEFAPLQGALYSDVIGFAVDGGSLVARTRQGTKKLKLPFQFIGYRGAASSPDSVLLKHNGLHIDIVIDHEHFVGCDDAAGIADIVLESALTVIMDMEDSVAAVDADDKVAIYRNWLGLTRGALTASFDKGKRRVDRQLGADRTYSAPGGTSFNLPGRSLMLVRNVGLHIYTDAVKDEVGASVPEGIVDLFVTGLIARFDLRGANLLRNSRTGSAYIVKPKLHGPDEVMFVIEMFGQVEHCLGIASGALKIGIMDEERRTSVNLMSCIEAAKDRVFFINTGFLDRTGDEIHTSMEAGAMRRKNEMKIVPWLKAYEDSNVDVGLRVGLPGQGQIGKGMWAMPHLMANMLAQKIAQLQAGASTAWVPSPTAATLHALHYHMIDVAARQRELAQRQRADIDHILILPLAEREYSKEEILSELDNNLQSILGYVVRWVDQGIGCSKVPDVDNIALMEDRATLRISSQHVANWLRHGLVSEPLVLERLKHMAATVDRQNENDPHYRHMAPGFDGLAFRTARDLVLHGVQQPNGYTEFVLHRGRREAKLLVDRFALS